jgi:hypothetical protein
LWWSGKISTQRCSKKSYHPQGENYEKAKLRFGGSGYERNRSAGNCTGQADGYGAKKHHYMSHRTMKKHHMYKHMPKKHHAY